MGFEKGKPRHPKAGRQKGTPNKKRSFFESMDEIVTEDGKPVDVVKILFAQIMDRQMAPYEKAQLLLEFIQYLYPKQKAPMEITSGEGGIRFVFEDYTKK